MIINKRNGENYFDLIRMIDGKHITLEDQASGIVIDRRYYAIRHDVDHDIDHALAFARGEQAEGIKATYFLLPTAPYFDYSERFHDQLLELQEMGHNIGYHTAAITEWINGGKKAEIKDIIMKPLEFLRETGRDIIGTSSHGDPSCHELNYVNFQVWQECRPPASYANPDGLVRLSLKDVGLEYETYFLKRHAYLSDSGGRWQGGCDNLDTHERNPVGDHVRDDVIKVFNEMEAGMFQLLVHPCWWEVR